ncbi:MAG: hypothetical protein JWM04_1107, partial [Verrucomicrobiales bacterium]|nr:hypothetical protein [Verrucomicrobiales bacterium]
AERQWGTVREDYSPDGTAWEYFPHDHARSRAYRWGEDGIAGISDERQRMCLSMAFWNGKDPILKERLFGLTNSEGNHGEDVKELYYYLDATPTHSYLKMLYKYPQLEFPYARLVEENRVRGKNAPEFELLDTGIFDEDKYFDVFVEYAKAVPRDLLARITIHNRGPSDAAIHLIPQLWFRNRWSWNGGQEKPVIKLIDGKLVALDSFGHETRLSYDSRLDGDVTTPVEILFCENETNFPRLTGSDTKGFFKDAFHEHIVHGTGSVTNPENAGTKSCIHFHLNIPAGASREVRMRLTRITKDNLADSAVTQPFSDFDTVFAARIAEADEFYAEIQKGISAEDHRMVQRQAYAGMIWSKQFYFFDVSRWLKGDDAQPAPPEGRKKGRNSDWGHLNNADVLSMPDTWEYPWYAAWDLAFHCIPFADIDPVFAKTQLILLTREWYMHPNGQLPAYEWAFGDVNPPVHALAAWAVFEIDRKKRRLKNPEDAGDLKFLERVYHKLLINFTWWVNRKDAQGRNIFQGGFLGLDNIGVFDRSAPLPSGGTINQADGTAWMAMYSLNLMKIALELALHNDVYEDIATKFFEHFLHIAEAMNRMDDGEGGMGLWNEEDSFYYDVLNLKNGHTCALKVRSMVGLIPLFAVEILDQEIFDKLPGFTTRLKWFLNYRPDLATLVSRWEKPGMDQLALLSLLRGHRMKCLLRRALDETEFLSDYGIRALSKIHQSHPFKLEVGGATHEVQYWPGESESGLFGGNSNWRGPIWMPVNFLIIESLHRFHAYYGDDFKIECPTGSNQFLTIQQVAEELSQRLIRLFVKDSNGQRPVLQYHPKLASDPHFKDYVLFHEYFHGDTGRGVGASHQTGWTGLVASLLRGRGTVITKSQTSGGHLV